MDETTRARARRRGRSIVGGVAIGAAGLLAGALALGGVGPASADPPAWTPVTLNTGFITFPPEAPLYAAEYHVDTDGFVHLRGGVLAEAVEMTKLAVGEEEAGPWVAAAFNLPCGVRPEKNIPTTVVGNGPDGLVSFAAMAMVEPDGDVMVGGFDVPMTRGSGGEPLGTFIVTFDGGTFAADNDEVCPEPTTTTTEAETTTTSEP